MSTNLNSVSHNTMSKEIQILTQTISKSKILCNNLSHEYIDSDKLVHDFSALENKVVSLNRKPVIGCFGAFDSGKSTFLNTIMGRQLLPESYQPATSVITLIMHKDDKPESIQGDVAIFKKGFSPHMIHSNESIDKYLMEDGDNALLHKLGVHDYDEDEEVTNPAYTAIMFEDLDILKTVWLLDTPGDFNTSDEEDTEKALVGLDFADIIIYISNQAGFLSGQELGYLTQVLRNKTPVNPKKPLEHILFIQSHCHPALTEENIKQTQSKCFKRLNKEGGQLRKLVFDSWIEDGAISAPPTAEELIERTHPFWRENEKYRENISTQISNLISYVDRENNKRITKSLSSIKEVAQGVLQSVISDLEIKKNDTTIRIQEVEEKDARFRKESHAITENFKTLINSCQQKKKNDLIKIETAYKNLISVASLEKIITKTYENKKQAKEEISGYISDLIQKEVEKVLKESSIKINKEVDKLLKQWQKALPNLDNLTINELDSLNIGLDTHAVFTSGLASLGSLGAMAILTSMVAGGSNLGAYIAVAHVGGFLTSIGVISSPAALTSFVAMLGGPLTVGLAISGGIGLWVYRKLRGKSWQNTMAENIHKIITEKSFLIKGTKKLKQLSGKPIQDSPLKIIQMTINDFWDNTEKAITVGFDELQEKTEDYIQQLIEESNTSYDIDKLDEAIEVIKILEQLD